MRVGLGENSEIELEIAMASDTAVAQSFQGNFAEVHGSEIDDCSESRPQSHVKQSHDVIGDS